MGQKDQGFKVSLGYVRNRLKSKTLTKSRPFMVKIFRDEKEFECAARIIRREFEHFQEAVLFVRVDPGHDTGQRAHTFLRR